MDPSSILVQLPKHKEWPRLDASSRAEYTQLKMEMQDVAHRLEEMKVILKQRYADYMAEKAARMSPAQPPTKSAPTLNEISTRITNLSVTMPPSRSVSPVPSSPQVATVSSVLPQPLQVCYNQSVLSLLFSLKRRPNLFLPNEFTNILLMRRRLKSWSLIFDRGSITNGCIWLAATK